MTPSAQRRFVYGDQFDKVKTPLLDLLQLCTENNGDRPALQEAIRESYFPGHGNSDNSKKMAMNCLLSLNAYGLISFTDKTNKQYDMTDISRELVELAREDARNHLDGVDTLGPEHTPSMFRRFAVHILTELNGLLLLRLIENIRARGEQVTLEYLGEEMNDLGLKIPPNSTYISTMRSWLAQANVFHLTSYEINWDVVYDLLHMDAVAINRLYDLSPEQKYFLLSLVSLDAVEFMPSNAAANHARSVYSVRITTKNLVKDVIEPLEERGLIESRKTTVGRGAKPHDVRLTQQAQNDLLKPLLESLSLVTELTTAELNRTFESVVADLQSEDIYIKGIALELFAVWIIRLLGLRFSQWRLRSKEATGGGEVDVMAASDKIVYSRWQIQCKNVRSVVTVDTIAKEVGMTFATRADVVMVITTSSFSGDAVSYANLVTDTNRQYVILLDGNDIERIIKDRARIVDILNIKARRVFAKRELGVSDLGGDLEEAEEEQVDAALTEGLFAIETADE